LPLPRLATATVAICAYTMDRWDDICAAVASVLDQLRDGDECLLVIDYNDELRARAEAEFGGHDAVRVLANNGPRGLSGGRNTAIEHSRGEMLAFLDDDAVADPTWLDRLRAELVDDEVIAVGAASVPMWPDGRRPGWFPSEFYWIVGCSYTGLPTTKADVRNAFGGTMAFRRTAFDLAGNFSSSVGRVGRAATGCEETELCIRMRQAKPSARIVYLPDVGIQHRVTAERLRVKYFFRRCYGEGRSKARLSRLLGASDGLSSERSYVRQALPRGVRRELGRAVRGNLEGLAGATLIVAGVFVTGFGYVVGRATK
jgi:glycosyltransferase involved in cell wall biosynthesis